MTDKLKPFVQLVDFLADFLGDDAEIVLHDMTDYHCSVVAIRNGHISGRHIGSPISDMSLSMVRDKAWKDASYRVNYKGTSISGEILRCATYFIRDEKQELIGLLCINMNCQKLLEARDILDHLTQITPLVGSSESDDREIEEDFSVDVKDLVVSHLRRITAIPLEDLKKLRRQKKIELVEKLHDMGTFMIKGTIWEVANIFSVSVPTIYRYLATIRKEHKDKNHKKSPTS